jgi:hypothetical protein
VFQYIYNDLDAENYVLKRDEKKKLKLTSNKQKMIQPVLLPHLSTYNPKKVPKTALVRNPVRNSFPTFIPYDYSSRENKE